MLDEWLLQTFESNGYNSPLNAIPALIAYGLALEEEKQAGGFSYGCCFGNINGWQIVPTGDGFLVGWQGNPMAMVSWMEIYLQVGVLLVLIALLIGGILYAVRS